MGHRRGMTRRAFHHHEERKRQRRAFPETRHRSLSHLLIPPADRREDSGPQSVRDSESTHDGEAENGCSVTRADHDPKALRSSLRRFLTNARPPSAQPSSSSGSSSRVRASASPASTAAKYSSALPWTGTASRTSRPASRPSAIFLLIPAYRADDRTRERSDAVALRTRSRTASIAARSSIGIPVTPSSRSKALLGT